MAYEVLVAATGRQGAAPTPPGALLLPARRGGGAAMEPRDVAVVERPPLADLRRPPQRGAPTAKAAVA